MSLRISFLWPLCCLSTRAGVLDTARQSIPKVVVGVRSTKEKETRLLNIVNSNFQLSFDLGATTGECPMSCLFDTYVCVCARACVHVCVCFSDQEVHAVMVWWCVTRCVGNHAKALQTPLQKMLLASMETVVLVCPLQYVFVLLCMHMYVYAFVYVCFDGMHVCMHVCM